MRKIKILITSTSGFTMKEGISTVILDYFSRFNMEIFEPHIVIAGEFDKKLVEELKMAGIAPEFLHSRKKELVFYIRDLFRLFKCGKYDVLYANGSSAIMSIELFVAMLCGCKVRAVHSHNTTCDHKMADMLLRPIFFMLYTDAFACGNEAGKWLFCNRKFIIARNGREISKYVYDEEKRKLMRRRLGIADDCLLVGHVGNFNQQKNQQFVIGVFKELLGIKENAKLFLIGSGHMIDDVKQIANKMGISERVVFTGSLSNVEEMLQAMDVMILPSLYEGFPLVVVEWQLAGLPCIVSENVTQECAFTDLVYFKSLELSYYEWAKSIIDIASVDRENSKAIIIESALKFGYSIEKNATELQRFFEKKVLTAG